MSSAESIAEMAPIRNACARFSASLLVTIACAPMKLARANAAVDTPEPIPTISTVSPGASRALFNIRNAVRYARGNAALSNHVLLAGRGRTFLSGAMANVA